MAIVNLKRRKGRAKRRRQAVKRAVLPAGTPTPALVAAPTPTPTPTPAAPTEGSTTLGSIAAAQTTAATSRERLYLNRLGTGYGSISSAWSGASGPLARAMNEAVSVSKGAGAHLKAVTSSTAAYPRSGTPRRMPPR